MLGVYLHIPFCQSKCSYCDFFSVTADSPYFEEYPQRLERQLELAVAAGWKGPVTSVYFGGGTPSLFPAAAIGSILDAINRHLGVSLQAEISLEANPDSITLPQLQSLRSVGVNRLSLGLQSLDDRQLRQLGRRHDRQAGVHAVRQARQAGYDNLSLDLMFALPGQTPAQLEIQLNDYLALDPEHLSCYGLTAEDGTPLQRQITAGELALPDEECYRDAFLLIDQRLRSAGYQHYEIANYARPGRACQHNLGYWRRQAYLGLGAGAHSFVADQWGSRWATEPDLERYQQAVLAGHNPIKCLEHFDKPGALSETLYLGLRTAEGVSSGDLHNKFGVDLADAYPRAIRELAPWLVQDGDRWSFTIHGWLLFDRLIQAFLQPDCR